MTGSSRGFLLGFLAAVLGAAGLCRGDELQLFDGSRISGAFGGYDARKGFQFYPYLDKDVQTYQLNHVKRIEFPAPAAVEVFFRTAPKKARPLRLASFRKKCFLFSSPEKKETQAMQIHRIACSFDMTEFMAGRRNAVAEAGRRFNEEAVAAEDLLVPGKITIIHFYENSINANLRQGNYAHRLCLENKKRAAFVSVPLDSIENKTGVKNHLDSLPQFWFYSRRGKLCDRLVDRFTDEDILEAARKTLKSRR